MYDIEVRNSDDGGMTVELRGELDLASAQDLQSILDNVVGFRRQTTVDLSSVTFLDLQSTRELAVRSRIYAHHLTFVNPSWQVHASVKACKLEDWMLFEDHPTLPNPRPLKKVS